MAYASAGTRLSAWAAGAGGDDDHDEQVSRRYAGHLPSVTVGPPAQTGAPVVTAAVAGLLRALPRGSA